MRSNLVMGLVSAGSVSQSFLSRLPSLRAQLGPIKANSSKTAKQAARASAKAYAISHYSALEPCNLVWVAVPEPQLPRVFVELASQVPIRRTMIVLCDCERESTASNPLTKLGARIASLNVVDETKEKMFVAEGDAETLSTLKRLLWMDRRRLIQMAPGAKPVYLAGLSAATGMILPWLDTSVRFLRAAGFTRADAVEVSDALVKSKLREYAKAGVKSWKDVDAERLRRIVHEDLDKLLAKDSRLARAFANGARHAAEHFRTTGTSAAGAGN